MDPTWWLKKNDCSVRSPDLHQVEILSWKKKIKNLLFDQIYSTSTILMRMQWISRPKWLHPYFNTTLRSLHGFGPWECLLTGEMEKSNPRSYFYLHYLENTWKLTSTTESIYYVHCWPTLCDVRVCIEEPQPIDFHPGNLQYMCHVTKSYKLTRQQVNRKPVGVYLEIEVCHCSLH